MLPQPIEPRTGRRGSYRLATLAGIVLFAGSLGAVEHRVSPYAGPAPRVDGVLDDAIWESPETARVPLTIEWSPGENVKPPVETDAFVAFSATHLYLAWRCFDPEPEKIRAHLMDRDDRAIVSDDHVLVTIDTFNDERRGYQLRINPLGVKTDAVFSEGFGADDSFDLLWDAAGRIDDEGYSVEVAVPWSQLRFHPADEQQVWGFDLQRSYPRKVRHRISAAGFERGRNCILCQVTKIGGFIGMTPGRNLEITPTLVGVSSEARDVPTLGRAGSSEEDVDAGVSVRWGPTPNLTLNLAVNPDFSQVEADAARLDVNQRFALFFAEKRPFFLEGADLFRTPIQAVFTRTVADPDWGLKLTGKVGRNAYGLFATRDSINNFLISGNQFSRRRTIEEEVDGAVLRFRRDLGERSTVGLLWTGREGETYRNHVYGVDWFLRLGGHSTVRGQYLRSSTRYPGDVALDLDQPTDSFDDDAFLLAYNYNSRRWQGWLWLDDLGELFRADSGYVVQTDVRSVNTGIQHTFWGEEGAKINQWGVWGRYRRFEDQAGRLSMENNEASWFLDGPRQSFVNVEIANRRERFLDRIHEGLWSVDSFSTIQLTPSTQADLFFGWRDEIDLVNNRVGKQWTVSPDFAFNIGRRTKLQLEQTFRQLQLEREGPEPGGKTFQALLTELRLIYNFNVRSFVRLIVQYQDLERDPQLYPFAVESRERSTLSQLLYSYKLNAQTVLFAGYSENRLGVQGLTLQQTDRTFFAKLGYVWSPSGSKREDRRGGRRAPDAGCGSLATLADASSTDLLASPSRQLSTACARRLLERSGR